MLDVGWSELVLIGVVALIFVGPKDLPRMFHALGRFTAKARGMAREFQRAMDDAAKSSGLDDVRKDLSGVKAGLNAATNPAGFGINALEDAARKFENWDPKSVLKPAVATAAPAATAAAAASATAEAAPVVTVGGAEIGAETKALADKRASEVAAARAKAHELQAKAAQSASATFAARAKADAEAAAAKAAAAATVAEPEAKPKRARKPKEAEAAAAVAAPEEAKPARKPPVRRKKSEA